MKKLLSICTILACSASAADPVKDFYLKGDLGAIKQTKKMQDNTPYNDGDKLKNSPVISLGAGYKLSEDFRTDVTVQFRNIDYKGSLSGINTDQKTKNYTAFLNGYYDLNNSSIFTPYVTAGLGIARNDAGGAKTSDGDVYKGKTNNNFAWNAGFGSKMKMSDQFDLDLGYRYTSLGKVSFNDAAAMDTAGTPVKLKFHELTLGVSYNF